MKRYVAPIISIILVGLVFAIHYLHLGFIAVPVDLVILAIFAFLTFRGPLGVPKEKTRETKDRFQN